MKYFPTPLSILLITLCSVAYSAERPRNWRVSGGELHRNATLVEVDALTGTVTIELVDGSEMQIASTQLSPSDRLYVARAERRRSAASPNSVSRSTASPPKVGHRQSNAKQKYGVLWHDSLASARNEAQGRSRFKSARPIFCFRVLGEMDGFM